MMRLGQVIKQLETADPSISVRYDFGCVPTSVDSWRGAYAEPALGWVTRNEVMEAPSVELLLRDLKGVFRKTYHGYKGGEYRYTQKNRLHIDNYGHSSGTEIAWIEVGEYEVVIHTQEEEYTRDL